VALALAAGLAVWVIAIAATTFAGDAGTLDNPAGVAYPLVAGAGYVAMAAVLLLRLPRLLGGPIAALGLRPLNGREMLTAGVALLIVVAMRLAVFGYLTAIGQPGHVQAGLAGFRPSGPLAAALAIGVGATLAPFSEELLFRGTIYRALAQRMPDDRAAIASGLCFAAARFDLVLAPFFVAYGTLLAIVYRRTGNLFVPVAVRAVFDGASYALLVWLDAATA
jgi:membrane protease YdiL (CAAX protease family)